MNALISAVVSLLSSKYITFGKELFLTASVDNVPYTSLEAVEGVSVLNVELVHICVGVAVLHLFLSG